MKGESTKSTCITNPTHCRAMKRASTLSSGYEDNKNGFGVIMRQMLLNADQKLDISNPTEVDANQYSNSTLHFMGQVIFSILHGSEQAKFVADMHERGRPHFFNSEGTYTMTTETLDDYEDIYRDLLNHEYGRQFGIILSKKYGEKISYKWPPETTAGVLNDIQGYLGKSYDLKFKDFKPSNPQLVRFTDLINENQPTKPTEEKPIEKY